MNRGVKKLSTFSCVACTEERHVHHDIKADGFTPSVSLFFCDTSLTNWFGDITSLLRHSIHRVTLRGNSPESRSQRFLRMIKMLL